MTEEELFTAWVLMIGQPPSGGTWGSAAVNAHYTEFKALVRGMLLREGLGNLAIPSASYESFYSRYMMFISKNAKNHLTPRVSTP
jgi:hypothetical protein